VVFSCGDDGGPAEIFDLFEHPADLAGPEPAAVVEAADGGDLGGAWVWALPN
jgi:hypothetical protein